MASAREPAIRNMEQNHEGMLPEEEVREPDLTMDVVEDSEAQNLFFDLQNQRARFDLLLQEYQDIIGMRQTWSTWILRCVLAIVAFDILLMILIGVGALKYSNDWVVPAFIGDSLIKVIGLAIIIVGYLFGKSNSHETRRDLEDV